MRTFEDATYAERFGVELVRYRHHFQLTQDELAEKCGLSRYLIIGLENAKSKIDIEVITLLKTECKDYLLFMLLYSRYGEGLVKKFPLEYPFISQDELEKWVNKLAKKYPVYGPRYYDKEGRRVVK